MFIAAELGSQDNILQALKKIKGAVESSVGSGGIIIVKVEAETMDALRQTKWQIRAVPQISSITSTVEE